MTRKIMFNHRRALGDTLMMTAGIRDFKKLFPEIEINVSTPYPQLWENNPYLNKEITKRTKGVECYTVGYPTIQHSSQGWVHFTQGFLFDMIAQVDNHEKLPVSIGELCASFAGGRVGDENIHDTIEPFISWRSKYKDKMDDLYLRRGDIHLTDKEKKSNIIKDQYGIDKYWVIAPGGKSDCTCKIWDWRRFQDVIDTFDGYIKFVVIGKSDLIVEPLNNIIDLTDKLNYREIFSLVNNAEGGVGTVSFLMHVFSSLPVEKRKETRIRPFVAIYGAREGFTFTAYEGHQVLHTIGSLTCSDNGGCWHSRIVPMAKKVEHNSRLCTHVIKRDGRLIQQCMDTITSADVIRAIGRYYEGNIYNIKPNRTLAPKKENISMNKVTKRQLGKEINVLASLRTPGGGEQSIVKITKMLRAHGWKVNFHPWGKVNDKFNNFDREKHGWGKSLQDNMKSGIPLLFYANDDIYDFCDNAQPIVDKSSDVIVCINWANGRLPKTRWIEDKLKAVIFHNNEKKEEFKRDCIGFDNTKLVSLFGAIDLDSFISIPQQARQDKQDLVVLKHCTSDYRKYITTESHGQGDEVHVWQKHIYKELDTKFYDRLLKDTTGIRFEFMAAHAELIKHFDGNPRMVFHKWDSMPVSDFLSRGHVYLYRTSNMWRDQYPRCVAEALAAGIPVLSEPRDGTKDRIIHGDTGFYCVDYDGFLYALKMLQRKEDYRAHMGDEARRWAKKNLRPEAWIEAIGELCTR